MTGCPPNNFQCVTAYPQIIFNVHWMPCRPSKLSLAQCVVSVTCDLCFHVSRDGITWAQFLSLWSQLIPDWLLPRVTPGPITGQYSGHVTCLDQSQLINTPGSPWVAWCHCNDGPWLVTILSPPDLILRASDWLTVRPLIGRLVPQAHDGAKSDKATFRHFFLIEAIVNQIFSHCLHAPCLLS